MADRIYLDWNATAPLSAPARGAMLAAVDMVGNASSVHGEGRTARRLVEAAREQVAALVGAEARNVVFTSGGSEANALALTPAIEQGTVKAPLDRLLVSAIEHPSVQSGGRFARAAVEEIPVTSDGIVDLSALRVRLANVTAAEDRLAASLPNLASRLLGERRAALAQAAAALSVLGPQATLERGYGIVRRAADDAIVRDPAEVSAGSRLRIRVARGEFPATADDG